MAMNQWSVSSSTVPFAFYPLSMIDAIETSEIRVSIIKSSEQLQTDWPSKKYVQRNFQSTELGLYSKSCDVLPFTTFPGAENTGQKTFIFVIFS